MSRDVDDYKRRHLRLAWWTLLLFTVMGGFLEALQGFKIPWYLSPSHETRRLMWTLAHAHGTLLGLFQIGFAATLHICQCWHARLALASNSLIAATVLLPGGFFLGGVKIYSGDPGIGILLVPAGAVLLTLAIVLTAISVRMERGQRPARSRAA